MSRKFILIKNKISKVTLWVYTLALSFASINAFAQTPIAKLSSSPAAIMDTIKICQGQRVVFFNILDSTLSQTSYSWTLGSSALPTAQSCIGPYIG